MLNCFQTILDIHLGLYNKMLEMFHWKKWQTNSHSSKLNTWAVWWVALVDGTWIVRINGRYIFMLHRRNRKFRKRTFHFYSLIFFCCESKNIKIDNERNNYSLFSASEEKPLRKSRSQQPQEAPREAMAIRVQLIETKQFWYKSTL